jgi:hypothetical protein
MSKLSALPHSGILIVHVITPALPMKAAYGMTTVTYIHQSNTQTA